MTEIDYRITAAAVLLDGTMPGWADKIDVDKLDMDDGENCILGQLYGDFTAAPRNLKCYTDGSYRWAFDAGASLDDWAAEIMKRAAKVKTVPVSDLESIKSYEEFVAYRDKVTDREITVTIKASDARRWIDLVSHPAAPAKAVHDALKAAL